MVHGAEEHQFDIFPDATAQDLGAGSIRMTELAASSVAQLSGRTLFVDSTDSKLKAKKPTGALVWVSESRGDLRSYKTDTSADYLAAFNAALTGSEQVDSLFVPPGIWQVSNKVVVGQNKGLFSDSVAIDQQDVGAMGAIIKALGPTWPANTPVVDLSGLRGSLVGIRVDGSGGLAPTALLISGAECVGRDFTAANGSTHGLNCTGDRVRLANFVCKAAAGGTYAFLHSGLDAIVDAALFTGGSKTFETTGAVGKWSNIRATGAGGANPVARVAGDKNEFAGFLIDGGIQSLLVAGSHHQFTSLRFHGSGHDFTKGAIQIDGSVVAVGNIFDDFELTPTGTAPVGTGSMDPGSPNPNRLTRISGDTFSLQDEGKPILVRGAGAMGSDLKTSIKKPNGFINSNQVDLVANAQTLVTEAVYLVRGWAFIIEFLGGSQQVANAGRTILGSGHATWVQTLWNVRPGGGIGNIESNGKYARKVSSDLLTGGTTLDVIHGLLKAPTRILYSQSLQGAANPGITVVDDTNCRLQWAAAPGSQTVYWQAEM